MSTKRNPIDRAAYAIVNSDGHATDVYLQRVTLADVSREHGYRVVRVRITEIAPKKRRKGNGK